MHANVLSPMLLCEVRTRNDRTIVTVVNKRSLVVSNKKKPFLTSRTILILIFEEMCENARRGRGISPEAF